MAVLATWWRRVGGVLAAAVLCVMIAAPIAQAAVCADEPAVAVASLDVAGAAVASPDLGNDADPCEDGGCVCIHCHSHHAGAYTPVALTDAQGPAVVCGRHRLAEGPSPPSSLTFGFKRPPRG